MQEWINERVARNSWFAVARLFPNMLLAVAVGVLDEVYKKIAVWLNELGTFTMLNT